MIELQDVVAPKIEKAFKSSKDRCVYCQQRKEDKLIQAKTADTVRPNLSTEVIAQVGRKSYCKNMMVFRTVYVLFFLCWHFLAARQFAYKSKSNMIYLKYDLPCFSMFEKMKTAD